MTLEQRQQIEMQIKTDFSELQERLEDLRSEVQNETDETKKQEKNEEIQNLESELSGMKTLIDKLKDLQEQDLNSLKTRLQSLKNLNQKVGGETADLASEVKEGVGSVPTTYELLKDSETCNRLINIISSNPKEFSNLPGDTPEKKLEYIFTKIRSSIVLFMKNKLGDSETTNLVISNTIAPAFEWNLMEMLRDQGNEANIGMLKGIDKISRDSFNKLVKGVSNFANKTAGSYAKFSQWLNAIDYLSVHNGVLRAPNKSEILTSPVKFQEYMNDPRFSAKDFSPYSSLNDNIFKVDKDQNFNFNLSDSQKQEVLQKIGNIQIVNNPKTTALIAGMLDKPEQFLQKTQGLQKTANGLLDGIDSINSVTKVFGCDILGDISKPASERGFIFKILDFVCKLIGITGGLEGIVKKWRMDRMNLTDEKNENISQIFDKYKEEAGDNISLSVTGPESCKSALNVFAVTDPRNQSSTQGDYLRDAIADNVDIGQVSPAVVQEILGAGYLKKEIVTVDGKQQEKISVDASKISENEKKQLAHKHLQIMKSYLESDYEALKDFYSSIHSSQDLALCMTASLYASRDDVIEGVKAKVFLPENYGSVRSDGTVSQNVDTSGGDKLDSTETSDKQKVSEKWMYDKITGYGITDKNQIAYILATVKGETNPDGTGFINVEENGKGKGKEYGNIDPNTNKAYYGRGFVQLTWKRNYEQYTEIIRKGGRDFKDNEGKIIKGNDINLIEDPDTILRSNELAAFILVHGMKNGTFTGKKLDDYINGDKVDFEGARKIVNGNDRSQEFANNAQTYLDKLSSYA